MLKDMLGDCGEGVYIEAPFYANFGGHQFLQIPPLFSKTFQKTIDKPPKKCGASRPYL